MGTKKTKLPEKSQKLGKKKSRQRKTCQKCGSKNIVEVEYDHTSPEHYDGISEIYCRDCKSRFGRWSGKELTNGETEKRFGGK